MYENVYFFERLHFKFGSNSNITFKNLFSKNMTWLSNQAEFCTDLKYDYQNMNRITPKKLKTKEV